MSEERVKVFVSHSFDSDDLPLVERILALMRARQFCLDVRTAKEFSPEAFPKKIESWVDWADVTFGIFTSRTTDRRTGRTGPPPFVVSECSYAMGLYRGTLKGVHGLVEKGLDYAMLGLPTASGEEFPEFTRQQFESGQTKEFAAFLSKLHDKYGPKSGVRRQRTYKQDRVTKTVEIYRTGTAVFKNTVTLKVLNGEAVSDQGIEHNLWIPRERCVLPSLNEMAQASSTDRRDKPVFSCAVISRNRKSRSEPMDVSVLRQSEHFIKFRLRFPFVLRDGDEVAYQYVWSVPGMFGVFEEDLSSSQYNEVAMRPLHGRINHALLRLKFERETVGGASACLFSKEPFIQHSLTTQEDGILQDPEPMRLVTQEATWETYEHEVTGLEVALVARWRPSSLKRVEADLEKAKFRKLPIEEESKARTASPVNLPGGQVRRKEQ